MNSRLELVQDLAAQGVTLREIGDALGVSRQRAYQIVKTLTDVNDNRKTIKTLSRLDALADAANARRLKWSGMTRTEFKADNLRAEQRSRLMNKKANARAADVEFDLRWEDLEWPTHCPVLGLELDYYATAGRKAEASASFDRIDPNKGYIKGNVKVISWRANRIKNNGSADEHRKIALYIDSFFK